YTKHKKPFIYYTQTVINIGQNQFLINKEQINAHLDSTDNQLKKYGILLLNKTDINLVEEDVKLSYIYSIPYTDERALVDVLINTTTGEKIIRVE
ncbi:MAG TPA: hypothetical protein VK559_11305, partial [Ferruginibacter sp.]|nr:hypothetical protein [Ferruginibacter sp.]